MKTKLLYLLLYLYKYVVLLGETDFMYPTQTAMNDVRLICNT